MYSLSFCVFAISLLMGGLAIALPYAVDDVDAIKVGSFDGLNSVLSANKYLKIFLLHKYMCRPFFGRNYLPNLQSWIDRGYPHLL